MSNVILPFYKANLEWCTDPAFYKSIKYGDIANLKLPEFVQNFRIILKNKFPNQARVANSSFYNFAFDIGYFENFESEDVEDIADRTTSSQNRRKSVIKTIGETGNQPEIPQPTSHW